MPQGIKIIEELKYVKALYKLNWGLAIQEGNGNSFVAMVNSSGNLNWIKQVNSADNLLVSGKNGRI